MSLEDQRIELLRRIAESTERTERILREQTAKPVASDYVNAVGRGVACGCIAAMLLFIVVVATAMFRPSPPTTAYSEPPAAIVPDILVRDVVQLTRPGKPDCKAEILEVPSGIQKRYMVRPIDGPERGVMLDVEPSMIKPLSH